MRNGAGEELADALADSRVVIHKKDLLGCCG